MNEGTELRYEDNVQVDDFGQLLVGKNTAGLYCGWRQDNQDFLI